MYPGKGGREIFLTFLFNGNLPHDFVIFSASDYCGNHAIMLNLPVMNRYRTLLNSLHMKTHRAAAAALWVLVLMTAAPLAIITASCGTDSEFRINGIIDGFGTGNLRLVYYSRDAVQSVTATAVDGKFMALARTDRPALVRVYNSAGKLLGRLIVKGGETIDVTFNATDPAAMKVSGNTESERLADFLKTNADAIRKNDTEAVNAAVETVVQKNPKWILSGLLMTDFYNPRGNEREALRLMALLDPSVARAVEMSTVRDMLLPLSVPVDSIALDPVRLFGTADSLETISFTGSKGKILMFTDDRSRHADSVTAALSIMLAADSMEIIDISADADTAAWHRSLRSLAEKDSPEVKRYWTPSPYTVEGLEELPVAEIPWFVLADSTGKVLYRGPAVSQLRENLKRK